MGQVGYLALLVLRLLIIYLINNVLNDGGLARCKCVLQRRRVRRLTKTIL